MKDLESFLVPIGLGLGVPYAAAGTREGDETFAVRVGGEFVELAPDSYDLWWQARETADVSELSSWGISMGIDDPSSAIERMLSDGILAFYSLRSAHDFARQYRLISNGSAGRRSDGGITLLDGLGVGLVEVDFVSYLAWCFSDGYSCIDDVSRAVARAVDADLEATLRHILVALPGMLSVGTFQVDLCRRC